MTERTSHGADDDKQGSEPEEDRSVRSSADQAKERERKMEESGGENAA